MVGTQRHFSPGPGWDVVFSAFKQHVQWAGLTGVTEFCGRWLLARTLELRANITYTYWLDDGERYVIRVYRCPPSLLHRAWLALPKPVRDAFWDEDF